MTNILVVEDDTYISSMLKQLLIEHGYDLNIAYSGTEAVMLLERNSYHIIILDLMLPGISGEEVLEKIRENSDIPVIGLSAKDDIKSRVNLIKNGADDYITKPFDNEELLVRIEALLRRIPNNNLTHNDIYQFKDLALNRTSMEVKIKDTPIILTKYEYLILELLMSYPNKVFTKNNIYESVWNECFEGKDNAINVHIGNLRKKFTGVNSDEQYIQTVWGIGFKMNT